MTKLVKLINIERRWLVYSDFEESFLRISLSFKIPTRKYFEESAKIYDIILRQSIVAIDEKTFMLL